MKFRLTNLLLIPLVSVLFLDKGFSELIYSDEDQRNNLQNSINSIIFPISLLLTFIKFNKFSKFIKIGLVLTSIYFFTLILESYLVYNTPFKYPHVFSKITNIYLLSFGLFIGREVKIDNIRWLNIIILAGVCLNLILINKDSLSLGAFLEHERGINASAVFLLLIPAVYFFIGFMQTKSTLDFILMIFTLFLIIFLQHRTVWVTTTFAFVLTFYILTKRNLILKGSLLLAITYSSILFIVVVFGVLVDEDIREKISGNIEDITHPTKGESTGGWRMMQFESYRPYLERNLAFGMRFSGFELPIQFYDEANEPLFDAYTGHHFHSFYVDQMFYFGFLGILIYLGFLFYTIRLFRSTNFINKHQLTMFAFVTACFLYGISYNFQTFFYVFWGLAIWLLESEKNTPNSVVIEDKIINNIA